MSLGARDRWATCRRARAAKISSFCYNGSMSDRGGTGLSAVPFLPSRITMASLREAAGRCRGCPLYKNATQTVFGSGRVSARVVLVGEQPGNDEDLQGKPFVGPAGRILNEALEAAGIARTDAYVTNVVKHFKWTPAGPRRLHKKPSAREIGACLTAVQGLDAAGAGCLYAPGFARGGHDSSFGCAAAAEQRGSPARDGASHS